MLRGLERLGAGRGFRVRDSFMGTVFRDFWSVIDGWVTLKYGTSRAEE